MVVNLWAVFTYYFLTAHVGFELTIVFGFSDYETQVLKADDVREMNPAMERAMNALKFVAQHVKNEDKFESVSGVGT